MKNNKFKRLLQGRNFYLTLAITLIATGIVGWIGTDYVLNDSNKSGGTSSWTDADLKQEEVEKEPNTSSNSSSSPQSSSSQSEASSDQQNSSSYQEQPQKLLYILPVTGKVSWDYSNDQLVFSKTMQDYRLHTGIDIQVEKGREVKAAAEGTVSKIYYDALWGNVIEIAHPDNNTTIYANLSDSVTVKKGDTVKAGAVISTVGTSADIESAEPEHLHFAVMRNGKYIDPMSIINTFNNEE